MTVYIGLLLFIAIVAFINKKTRFSSKYFLWLSFMAMALVLGLRGSTVGEDTENVSICCKCRIKNVMERDFFIFSNN